MLAAFALFAQLTMAQTADEIIENYFKATGGKDKWVAIKSIKKVGKLKAQGMEFPATMLSKFPNSQKMSFSFQGKDIVQPAFDGKEGWQTNMMTMKAEKLAAEDNEGMKEEIVFPDPFLDYKSRGYTVTLEGEEAIEGVACHKIKLTKKPTKVNGKEEENFVIYFFDKESGVILMSRTVASKGQMKGMALESFMNDYKEVDGLFFPFTTTQKMNGQAVATIALEKIEINVDIDDKEFAFPQN